MRLVVTRPEEDAGLLAERLAAMGHDVIVEPMLRIVADRAATIPDGPWRAILVTSANAIRVLAERSDMTGLLATPVMTVGAASAQAARAAGFGKVASADGDLDALAGTIRQSIPPGEGRLLYLTGRQVSGDLAGMLEAKGYRVVRVVLYEAAPAESLSAGLAEALSAGKVDGVLLFSRRTAQIWSAAAGRGGLAEALRRVTHYCLSPAVAQALGAAGKGESPVMIAERPDTESLLRLLQR